MNAVIPSPAPVAGGGAYRKPSFEPIVQVPDNGSAMDDSPPLLLSPPVAAAWQRALADAVTRPDELLALLDIDPALPALDYARLKDFPLRVPRGFVARMRRGDANDPLFLQVWPKPAEANTVPGFRHDAVGDLDKLLGGGLIHKYQGRALLIATGACGVHCRYCFRRHFPYSDALAARNQWRDALAQLATDDSIEELILSGGDPLSLSDDKLALLAEQLPTLPRLRRLRLHTRQPIVLPQRVDERLAAWLAPLPLQKVVVVHVNHAREIDGEVRGALARLRDCGATLLNQSVLLRGVNDSADTLATLSEALFDAGVLPYYLHLLDRAHGTAHFEVDEPAARTLMQQLNARLPGYLVPRLVREVAGAPGKVPVIA